MNLITLAEEDRASFDVEDKAGCILISITWVVLKAKSKNRR
jgi:hypothetical protein